MVRVVLSIYNFFEHRPLWLWISFIGIVAVMAVGASNIKIEEDITKFFPDDKKAEDLNYVFKNSKFVDQVVVMVSMKDSASVPDPDSLTVIADTIVRQVQTNLKPFITKVTSRIDDEKILNVFKSVYDYLPVFLDDQDYAHLDSALAPDRIRRTLQENYNQLISPVGFGLKKIILQDPLGFSFMPLQKMKGLQYDANFELYDGYIITKDHRHVIFFITPFYPPIETGHNTAFISSLNSILKNASLDSKIKVSCFGASSVAVGNAVQLTRDTILTISLVVIILGVFLFGFFRKKRIPVLIFIPVAFGALFSLFFIFLIKGNVSILALAAGSVILGIAVNYALHFLSHLKHVRDMRQVIIDLVSPMTLGSATTVLAFFCLQFTNAAVLRDVGLFAGFSLIGAALCTLIFLPHFIPLNLFPDDHGKENWVEKIPFDAWASKKYVVLVILIATPFFFYFARKVTFDSDVSKLNFMSAETKEAQLRLETINKASKSTIFVVSNGKDLEAALQKNERLMPVLKALKAAHDIHNFSSVSSFLISDSLQKIRLQKWRRFWTSERKESVQKIVSEEGKKLKFSDAVILNFGLLINKDFTTSGPGGSSTIRNAFFDDYIIEKKDKSTVITLANIEPSKKNLVYEQFAKNNIEGFDRQMMANLFVEYVNADFNFIVTFTAVLVFISLLISYGRIELTLITFVPMLLTWIWILGMMALFGIQFNIVNVMVSTFIFGLGDDYSIFIMDGLLQEYATGRKNLASIRTSIFLSAVTTITGLGVLFFAQHPAMRSIAAISIIGILSVFVMSQTIEPYLFRILISNRAKKGRPPMTLTGIVGTSLTYGSFIFGSVVMTAIGVMFRIIPIAKKRIKFVYHVMLSRLAHFIIYLDPDIRKKIIGRTKDTFAFPSIIIANHSSVVDILLTGMLHPKLILITNQWVWNSPILGGVVRLADYYPVTERVEDNFERLKARVLEGYSIVIFPEGTRSDDGILRRFHKGAFYLAEVLNIPIQPLLIHGATYSSPKGSFYLSTGQLTLKFLDSITPDNKDYGVTYSERTKNISRYFKKEFASLSAEIETQDFFANRLISNYVYKGPILEWYLRVKLRLEKNYQPFYELLPRDGVLLDLGCGYGFLCYMLRLRSPIQHIIGVDYDAEKIETAQHGYLMSENLHFYCDDVLKYPLDTYTGIVISDVLHYLQPASQIDLLNSCCSALLPGGVLIIRDGDSSQKDKHRRTRLTEFFSVKLLAFNKGDQEMSFISLETIESLAAAHGMTMEIQNRSKLTSNVLIVLRKSLDAGRSK